MARRYAVRADGWPVGAEVVARVWSCPVPTVQLVDNGKVGQQRFTIWTLLPFRRAHLAFPPLHAPTLYRARQIAFRRLRDAGGETLQLGRSCGLELARAGKYIGLECCR